MTDRVSPVSRIEPVARVAGIVDRDARLYQRMTLSLVLLFQSTIFSHASAVSLPLPLISMIDLMDPKDKHSPKRKSLKRGKKGNKKILSLFKKIVERK